MSVILGLSLSDRVYLLADSRVSYPDPETGKIIIKHDNMLKIETLESLDSCIIASAGDARFAQFIINNLKRDFSGVTIGKLRTDISNWARAQGDQYFQRYNSYANFIIAGVDDASKMTIPSERFFRTLDEFVNGKPYQGRMKSVLYNALNNRDPASDSLELACNKTTMFSLRIDANVGVTVEDAGWGDVLISGPRGVSKEDVGSEFIGRLEFEYQPTNDVQHDSTLLIAMLHTLIKRKNLEAVGGTLVPICLRDSKHLATINSRIYSTDPDGSNIEFISAYTIKGMDFYRLDENQKETLMEKVSTAKFTDDASDRMYTV